VGAALKLGDDYTVGVAVQNFAGSISWSRETEEHGYLFSFDTMTVDNMEDDYVVSDDYSEEIPSFTTSLPRVMTVGLANTTGRLLWAVDWVQGFETAAGSSARPRLAAGVEYRLIGLLPVRLGYGTGGLRGSGFAGGFGLALSPVILDFGFQTGSSLSASSAKGLNLAVSLGLDF
jgi:hypothetical protein